MGFFKKQLSDVVEWNEFREDQIFYKWNNNEIKAGSRLIIRPGQDAIFLYNGHVEGIFVDDGDYDIESQIIPFLSTLKGFRFGFNTGLRAEILFVNTKEFTVKWGTKNAINIPSNRVPGGLPIRSYGTFNFKVNAYMKLIDEVAGVKESFCVDDVKLRITSMIDQLLMKWISRSGTDIFNLQANAFDISKGIQSDLDELIGKLGITITDFNIMSITYPEEVQNMITKSASQSMVGDIDLYQKVSMVDSMAKNSSKQGGVASDMMNMMMGMNMATQMVNQMNQANQSSQTTQAKAPNNTSNASTSNGAMNFCPNCGTKTNGSNFCPNCGQKLN